MRHREEFRRRLADSGFLSFYLAFGPGNKRVGEWKARAERLPDPLRGLVDLFLLNQRLETGRVAELLGERVFRELEDEGVLTSADGLTGTDNFTFGIYHSLMFFFEFSIYPSVYFGNDSIALGIYQHPCPGGLVLDLCSGTGIQAMIASLQARKVHAVEINPRAARMAKFNIRLNSLEDKVEVFNGSFAEFAAQTDERFDRILFNPPLLPIPKVLHYPLAGDGGEDGLEISKAILALYLSKLSARGTVEFIGCGLGRDGRATFVEDLGKLLEAQGASGHVLLSGKANLRQGDLGYESTVATTAVTSDISFDVCHHVYDLHFQKMGANEMYMFFMRVHKNGNGNGAKRIGVTDLSQNNCNWFV